LKRWQSTPPRGEATDLPEVIAFANGADPGPRPIVVRTGALTFVHYSRSRLWIDRDAWEALPTAHDVLVQRVRFPGKAAYTIALTRAELEDIFGEVRASKSWNDVRCYHFPAAPPAVQSFLVLSQTSSATPTTSEPAVRDGVDKPVNEVARSALTSTLVDVTASVLHAPDSTSAAVARWARDWAQRLGGQAESADYLAAVGAWRDAWRPERVLHLLIAESHVAEEVGDTTVRVALPFPVPEALPASYCRLVYCLGYGEDSLCLPSRHGGTIQYWDIFGTLVGGLGNRQPRKADSDFRTRLNWKLNVLRQLRERGIWLVDACVAGVYKPGGGRTIARRDYDRMLRDSYLRFVWPSVKNEPLKQVWVVGIAVARALAGCDGVDAKRVIAQPQGDRSMPGRHDRELRALMTSIHRDSM
jgi:hypothetical protein